MKTFSDLNFEPQGFANGQQAIMEFDNGYGVSVINSDITLGGRDGLYEVTVLHEGFVTYDTDITDDVIGFQSESDISSVMKKVQELEA